MPEKFQIQFIFYLVTVVLATALHAGYEPGKTYHGFKLLEKRFVKEVNADCYYFEHLKSGARLLKISTDDANKTFSIAFKTAPESDCGTPHIMEHAVLNGSKHFPVKSPFDVLSKGSLQTFLNAMTGSDVTIYPVASMNDKDYFNLMHVYLDAVFYPLIYQDDRILKQEGWHHEMTEKSGPVVYKGVVYNEMKGAFSNPSRELEYQAYKRLFPDNSYVYSSGGYPAAIPTLTQEAFINFHRRYYHPDNSYIFLYGNADLDRELKFIDAEYLVNYDQTGTRVTIPLQKPFNAVQTNTGYYSVGEDANTADQTYLAMYFVIGQNTDRALVMALQALADVLVNQESGPIRQALIEAGIGKEVSAGIDEIQQNVFQIVVQNANPADQDRFRDVIMTTLKTVAEKGLDKKALEGTLNRIEFQLREGNDAQKGLTYNFQALPSWFFANDPFVGLEYEKPLAKVKTALQTDYLESIIRSGFLENRHALLQVLEPKPGLEKENSTKIDAELAAFQAKLSESQAEKIMTETQELIDYQKREDSPEALATIPLLTLADINPKAEWLAIKENKVANVPVLQHETFTNDVVYTKLYFDARVLPVDLIPYAALLAEVLGSLNTANYDYKDLDVALNIHTGGFSTFLTTFLENREDAKLRPQFVVSAKAMQNKLDKMFELGAEIVNQTRYLDQDRLKVVLTRHQSRLDSRIRRDGLGYARTRLESYYTQDGMFNELSNGVEYYWFITDLTQQFEQKFNEISANLTRTAALLFNKDNLTAAVTCEKDDFGTYANALNRFITTLKDDKVALQSWEFDLEKKNEGLQTASKVQYVLKGFDYKKLGYSWSGKMQVLNQILSSDWLQTQIRVIGGAYGGFCAFNPSGRVFFASYRDPNLKETVVNFDATPEYLKKFTADASGLTRYIIGTVAQIDQPLTPSARGDRAVRRYFEKITATDLQRDRDAVLATTVQDIRAMEKMVGDILNQNAICVYGNEEKIQTEKDLFGNLVKPIR